MEALVGTVERCLFLLIGMQGNGSVEHVQINSTTFVIVVSVEHFNTFNINP